ncbi:MAG: phenylalanine--tRNA ligase subunit beta [bacterium]
MHLSLNWLKDFVDIPKSITPEKLGELLSLHTVEVEKIEYQADKFKKVVVGKILRINPHPNADKLKIVSVDTGAGELEIVCGAGNISVGQFVPVALSGALLPNGMEIKPVEIRGVKSNGMLCAEDELGLGDGHGGIMILEKAKIGRNFGEYLGLNDIIFEVDNKSITHRADLWSHYGMARDMAAFLDVDFKEAKFPKLKFAKNGRAVKAKVEDSKLCPRYMAIGIDGVKIAPSPEWMQKRLSACGTRPINNIVDATNYVMLELGQPLHAFDRNFIDKIVVRKAKAGEIIETLDGVQRKLEPGMLVIANQKNPVAIAGIMGGEGSGINNNTESIIIESANFSFDSIRKTSQKLGLRTESSMRFEKGLDPNSAEAGLKRVVEIILEICPGAKAAGNLVDEKKFNLNSRLIKLDLNWMSRFMGHEFNPRQSTRILEKLGFSVKQSGKVFNVIVPTWRAINDVSLPADLAEEISRIYGYNNLKPTMPKVEMRPPEADRKKSLERKIKNILSAGAGFSEAYNYSFVSAEKLDKFKINKALAVKLANPLSRDLEFLRTSLSIGLLENIKTNQAREEEIAIYEIGNIFLNRPGNDDLPFQEKNLGMIWAGSEKQDAFRKLKGVIEHLACELDLKISFAAADGAAVIRANGMKIGEAFEIGAAAARAFGIKKKVAIAEIRLNDLFSAMENRPAKQYKEPPKYPEVLRDLAFVVDEKILYNDIAEEIKKSGDLISQVKLFDIYQGDKLGHGKKSLAFHVIYQAGRTLTSEEVDEAQKKIVNRLRDKLGAEIRDF